MSDESSSKNVASVWILVVLLGGLSVPFWRWDDSPRQDEATLQWVEGEVEPLNQSSPSVTSAQNSLVSATSTPPPGQAAELLQEFVGSDVGLQIQDAVQENQGRPGIPKQFQGEGVPLTDIKPWIPKPKGYDATPNEHQKLVGAGDFAGSSLGHPSSQGQDANALANSVPRSAWPDSGYPSGNSPIQAPTTMYYRADPTSSLATSPSPSTTASPMKPSPGQMVSSGRITASDPPALLDSVPNSTVPTSPTDGPPGNRVQVTPSPSITPPANPLRSGSKSTSTPLRRSGTVIQQPQNRASQ